MSKFALETHPEFKEGEYNPKHHIYYHFSDDGKMMDCNPKSYVYILHLEEKYNKSQKQLESIKFLIEQSDIKNMLWGKEILEIIGENDD